MSIILHIFAVYNQNLHDMEDDYKDLLEYYKSIETEEYKFLMLTDEYIDMSDIDEEDEEDLYNAAYYLIDQLISQKVDDLAEFAIRKLGKRYSKEEILRAVPKFVNMLEHIGIIVDCPVKTGLYIRVDKYLNWICKDFMIINDGKWVLGYYTPGIYDDKRSIIFYDDEDDED